ncbi:hypothetical protein IFM89_016014 [Coptis chinensis]|uniref:Ubiquitin-like domain-containing protein n=1 Tax=Coptis chinensis TaxID=261450 RepID=A0A835IAF4_9MAGN|nr:hypothetical protein IFM89_016014 [Coptis chinensis]
MPKRLPGLIFGDTQLEDGQTFAQYNVGNGSIVRQCLRLIGGDNTLYMESQYVSSDEIIESVNEIDETDRNPPRAQTIHNIIIMKSLELRYFIIKLENLFQQIKKIGEPWKTGLFDCHQNQINAIMTAFLPCMTFGQIAEVLGGGKMSKRESQFLILFLIIDKNCKTI